MTAQRTDFAISAPLWDGPDLTRQLAADFTVDDLLTLPDPAPRQIELIDGVMWVPPTPTVGHQNIGLRLWQVLDQLAPGGFEATTVVGVGIDRNNTVAPDVLVLRSPVARGAHFVSPDQVVIAVEVVSPSTRRRDRLEKPALLATLGVPYYWRIEQNPTHVYVYALREDRQYRLILDVVGGQLELTEPFFISVNVARLSR